MYGLAGAPGSCQSDDAKSWRAHMCGVCVALRDGYGHITRALLSTDAILLSQLGEALTETANREISAAPPTTLARRMAAPCPFRGLRRAEIVRSEEPTVQAAAALNVVAASEKLRDHVIDGDKPIPAPLLRLVDRALTKRLRRSTIGTTVDSKIRFEPLSTDITEAGEQSRTADETPSARGPQPGAHMRLHEHLSAAGSLYRDAFGMMAHAARQPERRVHAVSALGEAYGRLTHLVDAIDDHDDDLAHGSDNPLISAESDPAARSQLALEHLSTTLIQLGTALEHCEIGDTPAARTIERVIRQQRSRLPAPSRTHARFKTTPIAAAALIGLGMSSPERDHAKNRCVDWCTGCCDCSDCCEVSCGCCDCCRNCDDCGCGCCNCDCGCDC